MKPKLDLAAINLGLLVLLVLVMGNQLGIELPLGKARLPVTLADAVLALAAVGAGLKILGRRGRGTRFPPLPAFALVAAACTALARPTARPEAAKEILQLIEYCLVAFAVFLNVPERGDLKALLAAFAAAAAIAALWAGGQYLTCESPLDVRAGYLNRNALGAYLAMALPFLYGLALHVRCWGVRLLLFALAAVGTFANLSGGAVLATLAALGVLSAVKGQRALVLYLAVLCLAFFAAPKVLPRPHHSDILRSSVAPYVRDNFLLSDGELFARARELSRAADEAIAANPDAPPPRDLWDARHLMEFLYQRRGSDRRRLAPAQWALYAELQEKTARLAESFPEAAERSAFAESRLAVRYQRWHAAIACARKLAEKPLDALFGLGFVDYHAAIEPFRPGAKLQYFSNVPEVFNVATSEPFTHDIWLKALVQTGLVGLLALAWLVLEFIGRAARLYAAARSELPLGIALGALGGILGFALAGIFTETLARGLAMPFVFICSIVILAERIVHGEGTQQVQQLKRNDY